MRVVLSMKAIEDARVYEAIIHSPEELLNDTVGIDSKLREKIIECIEYLRWLRSLAAEIVLNAYNIIFIARIIGIRVLPYFCNNAPCVKPDQAVTLALLQPHDISIL